MSTTTISIPRKTISTMYRQIYSMRKKYEEMDHLLATLDEMTGKISHTKNTKTLAHDLGYSIY